MGLITRLAGAGVAVAVLLGAGCSGGDDEDTAQVDSDGSATTTVPPSDGLETSSDDAATDLDVAGSDSASDVERSVSETLSDLAAETRDGNTVITLPETVLFEFGQHELLPEATTVLDGLVEAIDYFAPAPVQVNGHTDSVGPDADNQTLSERRAQAVVDYFSGAGVDGTRLLAQGFGETQPIAPNTNEDGSDNPEGRAQNRRVEIVVEGVDLSDLDLEN